MGLTHKSYLGPYLRVTETVVTKMIDACEGHDFPESASFCPRCGTPKEGRFREEDVPDAPDDWQDGYWRESSVFLDDLLACTSVALKPEVVVRDGKRTRTYLYMPNRYRDALGIPNIEGGRHSEEEIPLEDMDIPRSLKRFREIFAREIAYMERWFGVEVRFGYLSYCS